MDKKVQNQNHYPKDSFITDSVICSKEVQKIAGADIRTFGGVVDVIVDKRFIDQNTILIKDKVVSIGVVPITITTNGFPFFTGNITFQEETECPGVCPGDTVTESPLQIEAIILQNIRNVLGVVLNDVRDVLRVKVILRTTITVTRPVITSKGGSFIDVNKDCCKTPTL